MARKATPLKRGQALGFSEVGPKSRQLLSGWKNGERVASGHFPIFCSGVPQQFARKHSVLFLPGSLRTRQNGGLQKKEYDTRHCPIVLLVGMFMLAGTNPPPTE